MRQARVGWRLLSGIVTPALVTALLAVFLGGEPARADAVALQVSKTAVPGEVRLSWTGGIPTYTVYRSGVPSTVADPSSQIGTTSSLEWLDTPPGTVAFFLVASPCTAGPPAVCCVNDSSCSSGEYCDGGSSTCAPQKDPGGSCLGANECASSFCVDGLCCASQCGDTCSACNVAGQPGTCGPVPDGTDPDAECGAVSCTGFYYGFVGDVCYRKADVGAGQATCNGAAGCRSASQECSAQTSQGPATLTCNPTCQDPTPSTCLNTTPGSCTNVNPGNQTCGVGACRNTVAQCVNGAPNACNPLPPTTETCNDIDDNCDGTVDNSASFNDGFESNNTCAAARTLASVGEGQTQTVNTVTLYPSGDVDIFRINANETGSTCSCCDAFCLDEDNQVSVTLTVPAGAGSYQFCAGNADTSCSTFSSCQLVNAGSSGTWTYNLDGSCSTTDNHFFYISISGGNAPGFECLPYTLSYSNVPGCF